MSVRLQFVCESAWSSRAIAYFTQGSFSHVDAVEPNGWLLGARHDHVGGAEPGVHRRPQGYLKFSRRVMFEIPASDVQSARFYALLQDQIGASYDTAAIWGFVLGRDLHKAGRSICSALQAGALETAGIIGRLYFKANKISPDALVTAITAARAKVIESQ